MVHAIKILVVICLLSLSACASVIFHRDGIVSQEEIEKTPDEKIEKVLKGSFVFGLMPLSSTVDLKDECPKGWRWTEVQADWQEIILRVVTLGVFQPSEVVTGCE